MEMDTQRIPEFIADRDAAMKSLDEAQIRAYMERWELHPLEGDLLWFSVHQARLTLARLNEHERELSRIWLQTHGYRADIPGAMPESMAVQQLVTCDDQTLYHRFAIPADRCCPQCRTRLLHATVTETIELSASALHELPWDSRSGDRWICPIAWRTEVNEVHLKGGAE